MAMPRRDSTIAFAAALVLGWAAVCLPATAQDPAAAPTPATPPTGTAAPAPATASTPAATDAQPAGQDKGQEKGPAKSDATPAAAFAAQPSAASGPAAAATPKTYTVPAGTKVLLQLQSGINTKSARPGDGVYLTSSFPVVVGNKVVIPTGVYVQGMVDRVQRAGQIKGRAQLDMHFTSIVFPNGSVVEIPGLVDALPGASNQKVKDGEGTIEQNPDKNRNLGKAAEIALPTGASAGTIGGAISGHPISGGLIGVGAGLAAMGITSLFTRGADVNIDKGTQVEMVLQRPLILEEANLSTGGAGEQAPTLIPSPNQPKPLDKPNRARVVCPPGSLGCE